MTHDAHLRAAARRMRTERNLTLDEITERLALPRTTVWTWIADLPRAAAPVSTRQARARRDGNLAMQEKYRLLREAAYEEGRASFDDLCLRPTFRDFVCMYLGEGSKRDRNSVGICNSDPAVMVLGHRWIAELSRNPLDYAVQYHADQDLDDLRRYWGGLLSVAPAAIRMQRKSNSGGLKARTWRSRYGVLTVRTGDTLLRARLEGWMDCLREQWTGLESRPRGA
jgi:hypothetical protein